MRFGVAKVATALALSLLLVACSWKEDGADWSSRRDADAMLARAASAGFPARVVVVEPGDDLAKAAARLRDDPTHQSVTLILVSADGVRLEPSTRYGKTVSPQRRRALETYALAEYIHEGDLDGAVAAAAREYLSTLVDEAALEIDSLPVVDAAARDRSTLPTATASWGAPIAVLLAATAFLLHRLAGVSVFVRRTLVSAVERYAKSARLPSADATLAGSAVVLFAVLAVAIVGAGARFGWDQALYFQSGKEILAGRLPFVDVVDVNPPAIMFLNVLPALFQRLTRLPAALAFNFAVLLLATCCTAWVARLLSRTCATLARTRRITLVFGYASITPLAWALDVFGQREHLVVLLLLPMVLVRWARRRRLPVGRLDGVITGVCAGIALSIKPQFFLPLALCEAAGLLRRPRRAAWLAPEWCGVAATGALYASLFIVYPAMRSELFGYYLPIFWRGYDAYNCNWRVLIATPAHVLVLIALATATDAVLCRRRPSLASVLALVMLGCDAVFVLEHKGWSYQVFPVVAVGAVWVAAVLPARKAVVGPVAVMATAAFCAFVAAPWAPTKDDAAVAALVRYVTSHTHPDDTVLVLSTAVKGPYPLLVSADRRAGSRFGWMPLLPMLYKGVGGSPVPLPVVGDGTRPTSEAWSSDWRTTWRRARRR